MVDGGGRAAFCLFFFLTLPPCGQASPKHEASPPTFEVALEEAWIPDEGRRAACRGPLAAEGRG